jgi:hypothetical protein
LCANCNDWPKNGGPTKYAATTAAVQLVRRGNIKKLFNDVREFFKNAKISMDYCRYSPENINMFLYYFVK